MSDSSTPTLYKFNALRTYSSTEWLADSRKKYRQVYAMAETSYIYAEFSFYNKKFDEEDWEATVVLKGFRLETSGENDEPLCEIEIPVIASRHQNIVYVREGWGSDDPGEFWTEGAYLWRASINGEVVAESRFFVYDEAPVTPAENPFFKVEGVQLFESDASGGDATIRNFHIAFDATETRFVFAELSARNHLKRDWMCELVFNFYNDARQLKGRTVELFPVKGTETAFKIASGWGSDFRGTWFIDNYTVEIVFMDTLIAVIPFEVGYEFEQGASRLLQGNDQYLLPAPAEQDPSEVDSLSLDEVLSELEGLVGLGEIKKRMREYAQYLQFINIRKAKGLEEGSTINLHAVFVGNPGTGKTTVARQLGRIYRKLGLLSRGHVHEVDRADLVGEYIGHTAPRVREAITQARGGILFIDEAYALMRDKEDSKDFGREVIELLVKEMSNGPGDMAVVVAGYPKEMEDFLNSNPGLKSRFPTAFEFDDYIPDELSEIGYYAATKRQITFSGPAKDRLHEHLIEAYRGRDRSFGNARYVFSLIDEAKLNLGLRIMQGEDPGSLSLEDLSLIKEEDVSEIFNRKNRPRLTLPVDEDLLHQSLDQLNQLIGLHEVKNEVHELVKLVRYYRETDRDVLNRFSLHTVFVGNPGTGKTTVAHLIGQIYKSLGILERGEVVVADRSTLVAQFIGQTAPKTEAVMEKARGSVLFIDEAYTLVQGGPNDFGKEALDTMLTRMEEMRGELVIIVAGYPDNMRQFLESNPGLKSRFDRQLTFPDYLPEELMEVCRSMLSLEGVIPNPEAEAHLEKYLLYIYNHRNKYFGNARAVRRVVEQAIKQQHLRLATLNPDARTEVALHTLLLEDVEQFAPGDTSLLDVGQQGKMGF